VATDLHPCPILAVTVYTPLRLVVIDEEFEPVLQVNDVPALAVKVVV
jgi:hypothetical protein